MLNQQPERKLPETWADLTFEETAVLVVYQQIDLIMDRLFAPAKLRALFGKGHTEADLKKLSKIFMVAAAQIGKGRTLDETVWYIRAHYMPPEWK
jgi:hypothetical protein